MKRFKAWLEEFGNGWCAVTHARFHTPLHRGRKVIYFHCRHCRRNWSEAVHGYVNPKLTYSKRGPSVLKGTDDVHEIQ